MRYGILAVLIALSGFTPSAVAQGHSDFAGVWTTDMPRSESAHQDVPVRSSTLDIRFTDKEVILETKRKEGDSAAFHETLTLGLDGVETTTTGDSGIAVRGKAHWDGPRLVVETAREINGAMVTTRYVYTLNSNARELTVDKTLIVQHGYQGVMTASNTGRGQEILVRASR